MIYRKEANFPYPVLSQFSLDYPEGAFHLDIDISELGSKSYRFAISYELKSPFLQNLLKKDKAELYIVFESKDVYFEKLDPFKDLNVDISKERISLDQKTNIQIFVVAKTRFSMRNNNELDPYYDNMKKDLYLSKGNVLAFSNVVKFNGDLKKPYQLFSMKVDKTIESEIKIELAQEFIQINFKKEEYKFPKFKNKEKLRYSYAYMGLQKALMKFLYDEGEQKEDPEIDIEEIDEPFNGLYFKLYTLMQEKNVTMLNTENVDEVIHAVSDNIIDKYCSAIEELDRDES